MTINHLIIPDTQVKPGVPTRHLEWIGEYIAHKRPDVIIHLGDHFDLPSLSSYDKGTLKAEGKKLVNDIEAGQEGLRILTRPFLKTPGYYPRMLYIPGNHDERITRIADASPELEGAIGWHTLGIQEAGWELANYLEPVDVNGILYCHYFANPMSGRAYTGSAAAMLKTLGRSFVMGHRQQLDFATRMLIDGQQQIGIIAGACYLHDEGYKGPQGNKHWRGVVMLNDVAHGFGNPMFVDIPYLERKYGTAKPKKSDNPAKLRSGGILPCSTKRDSRARKGAASGSYEGIVTPQGFAPTSPTGYDAGVPSGKEGGCG
jgi:hypothetical protein